MRVGGFVIHGNHKTTLAACLRSLLAVCDEVVTVDSCSSDGSAELVRSLGIQSKILPWQGCGAARGEAFKLLKPADYVFFLDADESLNEESTRRVLAWKQSAATLPYYTLQRRDWAELPTGTFLYRRETRKRLIRWDHGVWTPDMILHDALPKGASLPIKEGFIEHHFAQSVEGLEEKQDLYSLLYAVRLAAGGKRSRPTFGLRSTHVLRDAVIKGAFFRGGWPAVRLAWAVSKTHARKYEIIKDIEHGAHADLLTLFREQRFEALFKTALARFGA
jgi:glycosyltransferase involved in cell wall biosynthesis